MPHFIDTNVLLYAISSRSAEATKRDKAVTLLDNDDGALSIQVLQEFYAQATRPTRPYRGTLRCNKERARMGRIDRGLPTPSARCSLSSIGAKQRHELRLRLSQVNWPTARTRN